MSAVSDATSVAADVRVVEEFLYREASLLDERQLEEWEAVFRGDGVYWVPMDAMSQDPTKDVSIIWDDAQGRRERVYRLLYADPHSQFPPSRTLHVVGNVRLEGGDRDDGLVSVVSNQVILELRPGDVAQIGLGDRRVLGAKVNHLLDLSGDEPRIVLKRVVLLDHDLDHCNLSFLL